MNNTDRRRIVITGLGCVSPVGNNVAQSWQAIITGQSGIAPITRFDTTSFRVHFAGEVKNFDIEKYLPNHESRHMDTFIHYGMVAAMEAIKDSQLIITPDNATQIGVLIGSGIGGLPFIEQVHTDYLKRGARRIGPHFITATLANMISGYVSIQYGLKGPNMTIVSACSSSLHSIGHAARMIEYGDADVMIAGGTEATISPLGLGGFIAARALSSRNDNPAQASRPWDKDRDGFVLGEGAGVIVLEEYEHAIKRKAKIYAELLGFGMSSDGYHATAPAPKGEGAKRCMQVALKNANIQPHEVDYIHAHGTGTIPGDIAETQAIKECFKEHAYKLLISSTKSMTGHLLGGSGGFESVLTVMALYTGIIPPTINLSQPDALCDLDYCANTARKKDIHIALKNSFGFGGTNGTLVFATYDNHSKKQSGSI